MRKVFLEELPTKEGLGALKGKQVIDWINSPGKKVVFEFDGISGEIIIKEYMKQKRRIKIIYNEKEMTMKCCDLLECSLARVVGIYSFEYKFKIGEKIDKLTIIGQTKLKYKNGNVKAYKYICECGNVDVIKEYGLLEGKRCAVCCASSNKVVKGINDIATTDEWAIEYFVNKDDVFIYSRGSEHKSPLKCPVCGDIRFDMNINTFMSNGSMCRKCSDGKSYGEKFIYNILNQLYVSFECEKTFEWCNSKRYDFYITNDNNLIEVHGLQHYENCSNFKKTLKEEQENDRLKEMLAHENNIDNYIIIDCRYSKPQWIKNSILNSKLSELYDLSNINWDKCHSESLRSTLKYVCDLWNEGYDSVEKIKEYTNLGKTTIRRYLNRGRELMLCSYDPNKEREKGRVNGVLGMTKSRSKVILMYLNGEFVDKFESASKLERVSLERFGEKLLQSCISAVCLGKRMSYKGYTFKFAE